MAQEPHHPEHHAPAKKNGHPKNNHAHKEAPAVAPQPAAAPPVVTPFAAPTNVFTAPPGPAIHAAAITPSDGTALARRTTGIWVGGAGNVAVIAAGDDPAGAAVVFTAVPAGTLLPVSASYVKATGTTATNLVGLG